VLRVDHGVATLEFSKAVEAQPINHGRHRVQRFPFVAGVQLTALDTGTQIAAHIEDLSLFGCFVETTKPFAGGSNVRLRILHNGMIFAAEGKVAHSHPGTGMGIAFASIEPGSISVLDSWLTDAAEHGVPGEQFPRRSARRTL
jgi:PilZ domain